MNNPIPEMIRPPIYGIIAICIIYTIIWLLTWKFKKLGRWIADVIKLAWMLIKIAAIFAAGWFSCYLWYFWEVLR